MKFLKKENTSLIIIVAGFCLILFAAIAFLWADFSLSITSQVNSEKWGQLGDFIGGIVGTLWALAGVLLFYIALTEQRKDIITNRQALELQVKALNQQVEEFGLQRKELESSRKVYEQQSKTIRTQQFESHFYSLLNVYLKIKESLNRSIEANDYFKYLFDKLKKDYSEDVEIVEHHECAVKSYVKLFHEERGHLSHYFKCFYRLIKMIDANQFIEEEEKIQYSKILRSQLTDYEQLIMQYNSYSVFGAKARPLILKYNLLKHTPIFQKSEFEYYSLKQRDFNLLLFSDPFAEFLVKTIKDSFDIDFERTEISIRDEVLKSLVSIYFHDIIKVEITCYRELDKNGLNLSNEQFTNFLYNLVHEKIVFSTYTSSKKVVIKKYMTETDENRIFGITISIEEGVSINLNYDS